MKKLSITLSIIGVLLVILLQAIDFINIQLLQHYQLPRLLFLLIFTIFVVSIIVAFKKMFVPLIIMVVGTGVVILVSTVFEVELNYYLLQDERQEMISQLVAGEIKKEDLSNSGFANYHTPQKYMLANRNGSIDAHMYSEEKYFIFFQTAKPGFMDFVGLTEGFVYSASGEFPTNQEMPTFSEYRQISNHWYFVSSDKKRFENSCYVICGKPQLSYD